MTAETVEPCARCAPLVVGLMRQRDAAEARAAAGERNCQSTALAKRVATLEAALVDARDWMHDVNNNGPRRGRHSVGEMERRIAAALAAKESA